MHNYLFILCSIIKVDDHADKKHPISFCMNKRKYYFRIDQNVPYLLEALLYYFQEYICKNQMYFYTSCHNLNCTNWYFNL